MARSFEALLGGVDLHGAGNGSRRLSFLVIGWQAFLHIPSLSGRSRRRRRIEADSSSSVLPLGGLRSTASEAAGCATDGLPHVPLSFLCEPEENGGASWDNVNVWNRRRSHIDLLPARATSTATTMIAARPPLEMENAPFVAPSAPASSGSWGLSSPPLYPVLAGFSFCARTTTWSSAESRMALNMVTDGAESSVSGYGSYDGGSRVACWDGNMVMRTYAPGLCSRTAQAHLYISVPQEPRLV